MFDQLDKTLFSLVAYSHPELNFIVGTIFFEEVKDKITYFLTLSLLISTEVNLECISYNLACVVYSTFLIIKFII